MYWQAWYDELTRDSDYYINAQRDVVFYFYQSLRKEIQIEKLKNFLVCCKGITQVVVMGHSMSEVDCDYMEVIEEVICPKVWKISQYKNDPSSEDVRGYSFANKIKFYDLYAEFGR